MMMGEEIKGLGRRGEVRREEERRRRTDDEKEEEEGAG